jgi:hypothetical protein
MADQAKTYWASEPVHGPGGRFRVVVLRFAGGKGPARDHYGATLYRRKDEGDEEEVVEADFWQGTTQPHDGDKIRFREKAKKAAARPEPATEGA